MCPYVPSFFHNPNKFKILTSSRQNFNLYSQPTVKQTPKILTQIRVKILESYLYSTKLYLHSLIFVSSLSHFNILGCFKRFCVTDNQYLKNKSTIHGNIELFSTEGLNNYYFTFHHQKKYWRHQNKY